MSPFRLDIWSLASSLEQSSAVLMLQSLSGWHTTQGASLQKCCMNCVELAASSGMGLGIPDLPAGVSHLAGLWGARYISLPTSLLGVG